MKDISNPNLFSNNRNEFNKAQKRVIMTNEWDDKLEWIKEWQEEQERLKSRRIEDDLGDYQAYEQTKALSNDERKELLESNRKTPYEQKVEEIRKTLDMPDPNRQNSFNTMGAYGANIGQQHNGLRNNRRSSLLEPFAQWFKAGVLGKDLTMLEVENNKRLIKNANKNNKSMTRFSQFNQNNKTQVYESQEDQEYRMDYEDWMGYLYSYKVSGVSSIASGILTALKVKFLFFVPSYFILIPSLASLAYISSKLKQFNDGPLVGNILGKDNNVKLALKMRKEEKEAEKKAKENNNNNGNRNNRISRRPGMGQNSDDERRRRLEERRKRLAKIRAQQKSHNYDEDEEYDEDEATESKESNNNHVNNDTKDNHKNNNAISEGISDNRKVNNNHENISAQSNPADQDNLSLSDEEKIKKLTSELLEPKDNPNDEFEIPRSKINLKDKDAMYAFEDKFLNWVYLNRAKFAQYHDPKDILQIFAPMIANFNKSYANEEVVDRDSDEFKNLVCILSQTFSQIDTKFANADEHDPAFYFCVDEVKKTGLFYKLKIRLPQTIKKDYFVHNQSVLIDTLKSSNKDVVNINVEMPNNEGYIKIFRITTNSKGSAFLPLVSIGDVLRFKGMKADGTTRGVVEQMNKPNDLSLLFGLTNAEYAKVFDIADDQNTSIAVAGFTGSGKSASTGSWLDNLLISHSPDELGIIIMDAKSGSFWENFKFAPHVLGYFGREDIEKYPLIYKVLNDVYTYRQNHLNKDVRMKNFFEARVKFKKNAQWDKILTVPRLLIVGDEQLATLSELTNIDNTRTNKNKTLSRDEKMFAGFNDMYNTQTGSLSNVVREGGMTIMGLSQRTDMKSYPRTLLGASSIKFIMKLQFQADAEKMAPGIDLPDVSNLPVGSGYIYANGVNLSQLTTPLFSGDPELLEEMTRIIGLAWIIIQSYKEDLNREPQGYYLTAATKKNVKMFKDDSVEPFNLFNRDKIYSEAKEILRTGQRVHFSPDAKEGIIHIDLDKSEHIWEPSTGRPGSEIGKEDRLFIGNKLINQDDYNSTSNYKNQDNENASKDDTINNSYYEQEDSHNDANDNSYGNRVAERILSQESDANNNSYNNYQNNDLDNNDNNFDQSKATKVNNSNANNKFSNNDDKDDYQNKENDYNDENNMNKDDASSIISDLFSPAKPKPKNNQKEIIKNDNSNNKDEPHSLQDLALNVASNNNTKNNSIDNESNNNRIIKNDIKVNDKPKLKEIIKSKDEMTVDDLRNYFIKNDIKSMPLSDIDDMFNQETITMAINKAIISIDISKNEVNLL